MLELFITDLAAYNAGYLIGEWVSLPLDRAKLTYKIREILVEGQLKCKDTQQHQEIITTDFAWTEGTSLFTVDEYADVFALNDIVEELSSLDDHELLQVKFLIYEGYDIRYSVDHHEYVTIFDYRNSTSFKDVYELLAEDLVDEGCFGMIPDALVHYLDYSKIGRYLSYDYTEFEHGLLGRAS